MGYGLDVYVALFLSGCCDYHAVSDFFGGGTASISLSDSAGVLLEGSAVGRTTAPTLNDGEGSYLQADRSGCAGDEDGGPVWGTATARVCATGEIGDCGAGTVCFLSSFSGDEIGASGTFSTSGTFAITLSSSLGETVDAEVSAPSVNSGNASFETTGFGDGADSCLTSFQPTAGTASWAFDADPAWSIEEPEDLPR